MKPIYDDQIHEFQRLKSRYYYKPNVKSLRYFSKKLNLTREDIINKYGENVYMDEEVTKKARSDLKNKVCQEKQEKSKKLHDQNYKKYTEKINNKKQTNENDD